eukprot:c23303_g1_i2 orf=241-639(-)
MSVLLMKLLYYIWSWITTMEKLYLHRIANRNMKRFSVVEEDSNHQGAGSDYCHLTKRNKVLQIEVQQQPLQCQKVDKLASAPSVQFKVSLPTHPNRLPVSGNVQAPPVQLFTQGHVSHAPDAVFRNIKSLVN